MRLHDIMITFTEIGWWVIGKLITFVAVLAIIWGIMSWHDVVSDNLISTNPVDDGNMFAEVMEMVEWFK